MWIYASRQDESAGSFAQFRDEKFLKRLLREYAAAAGITISESVWDHAWIKRLGHGKPLLQWEGPALHFSISHSGPHWVCAVDNWPIGIDIEDRDKHRRYQGAEGAEKLLAIANRFYSPEEKAFLHEAADQHAAFYEVWVRKEAYLKYLGLGLSYGLSRFSVVGQEGFLEELESSDVAESSHKSGARLSGLSLGSSLTAAVCRHPDAKTPIPLVTTTILTDRKGVRLLESDRP